MTKKYWRFSIEVETTTKKEALAVEKEIIAKLPKNVQSASSGVYGVRLPKFHHVRAVKIFDRDTSAL